jgi:hypothetical protein
VVNLFKNLKLNMKNLRLFEISLLFSHHQ